MNRLVGFNGSGSLNWSFGLGVRERRRRGCFAGSAKAGEMLARKKLGNLSFAARLGGSAIIGSMRCKFRLRQIATEAPVTWTAAAASAAVEAAAAPPAATSATAEIAAVTAGPAAVAEVRTILVRGAMRGSRTGRRN